MNKKYLLNSGHSIPVIGLGTYEVTGAELIKNTIDLALSAGYRHIDTAVCYHNEKDIGDAITTLLPKHNLKREDIFITTKIIPSVRQTDKDIIDTIKKSVQLLQSDYVDLYLIHWPGVSGLPVSHPDNTKYRKRIWKILVEFHKEGLIRSIGVSNYTVRHMQELLADCDGVRPAVNQVECHPHYHQDELFELCKKEKIFFQAYSSLGTSEYTSLRDDPKINEIAKSLGKTTAQVLLRWAFQQDIGIIPKARSKSHIDDNIAIDFVIPEKDMEYLSNMQAAKKYSWNPDTVA